MNIRKKGHCSAVFLEKRSEIALFAQRLRIIFILFGALDFLTNRTKQVGLDQHNNADEKRKILLLLSDYLHLFLLSAAKVKYKSAKKLPTLQKNKQTARK